MNPLFPAKVTGTKILKLAEEYIWSNEFPKAPYSATEVQNFFVVDSETQRICIVIWWYKILTYWVPVQFYPHINVQSFLSPK